MCRDRDAAEQAANVAKQLAANPQHHAERYKAYKGMYDTNQYQRHNDHAHHIGCAPLGSQAA